MKHVAIGAMALSMAAVCAPAQAQAPVQVIAYTAKPVNVRAGPSRDYPVVAVLPAGFQVLVQGCLDTYAWCDVTAGYDRGWVYAGNITYQYDNLWQPLPSWAPVIGIAVLPFIFDDYWHQHYWNRPFYQDRWRWEHVPPPRFVRPQPPRHDGWRSPGRLPPGERRVPHERPDFSPPRPRAVPPGVQPAPQPQWHPQPRVAPAPRPVPQPQPQPPQVAPVPRPVPQPQQLRPQPNQQRPQGQQQQPPAGERRGDWRGEHDRR